MAMPNLSEQEATSPSDELAGSGFQFTNQLVGDLVAANLITLHGLTETWTMPRFGGPTSPELSSVTTQLGQQFLMFISSEHLP